LRVGKVSFGKVMFDVYQPRFVCQDIHAAEIQDVCKVAQREACPVAGGSNSYQRSFFVSECIGIFESIDERLQCSGERAVVFRNDENMLLRFEHLLNVWIELYILSVIIIECCKCE